MSIDGVKLPWPPPPMKEEVADQWGIISRAVPWTSLLVANEPAGASLSFAVLDEATDVMTIYPFAFRLVDVPRMLEAMATFLKIELDRAMAICGELPEGMMETIAAYADPRGGDVVAEAQAG